jgi:thiol-disulfide isomerase/thioredoxin
LKNVFTQAEVEHIQMIGERAPEFQDIEGWINSKPLTLAGLRGKVVFLDFWTFGCVNCMNTRPHFRRIYQRFGDNAGFVMIGLHTPEFPYERNPENVRRAVLGHDLRYPIGLDSHNTTWKLYGNHYWPRQAIIDREGKIRYEHVGEGDYEEMEMKISELLAEANTKEGKVGAAEDKLNQYHGNVNSLFKFKAGRSGFKKTSVSVDKVLAQALKEEER